MSVFSFLSGENKKAVQNEINLRRRIYKEGWQAGWNAHSKRPPYRSVVYRNLWVCGYEDAENKKYR